MTITFEYINSPPPPSHRFGYIVFKIRTKETLQEGDLFSNTANIYFDYNYPVITNEYETIIENNLELIDFKNQKLEVKNLNAGIYIFNYILTIVLQFKNY